MRKRFFSLTLLALPALLLATILYLPETQARPQQRRGRPSRRVTNPVRTQSNVPAPQATQRTQAPAQDATVISSAEDQALEENRSRTRPRPTRASERNRAAAAEEEQETLRRTVNRLSTQVTQLATDLGQLKDQQRTLVDLERLTRAEQRAEGFRAQLRDVTEKEVALQARSEEIDYELQPENIERRAALTGTLRPAELRDQIRRQLESEKRRVEQQLQLLNTSRVRLEGAINSADSEVERLRARMDENERRDAEAGTSTGTNSITNSITNSTNTNNAIMPAAPRPTPTPTPTQTPDEPEH